MSPGGGARARGGEQMAELAVYLVVYGLAYGLPRAYRYAQWAVPEVRAAAHREARRVRGRLRRAAAWRRGPALSADRLLADVGRANAVLLRAARAAGRETRWVVTPVWAPAAVPSALARLRGAPVVKGAGALRGEVVVAAERVPLRATDGDPDDDETRERADASGTGDAGAGTADAGADGFVLVSAAECVRPRRATLRQLYEFVLPVLAQTEAELGALAHARGGARRRAEGAEARGDDGHAGGGDDTGAASEEEEEEEEDVCCICMDGSLELVAPCGHAFCASCYHRWRNTSGGGDCPLCRTRLPSERGGGGAWVLADAPRGGDRAASCGVADGSGALGWVDAFFDKLPRLFEGA